MLHAAWRVGLLEASLLWEEPCRDRPFRSALAKSSSTAWGQVQHLHSRMPAVKPNWTAKVLLNPGWPWA